MYGAILGDIIGSPFELLYHLKDRSNKRLSIRQRKSITRRITQPFQVYLKSKGSYDNCADDERATIKTDADGYAVTGDLVYGTYHIYEVAAADGMHINHQYVEAVVNSKADNYESYIDKDGCPTVTIWTRHRSTFIWSIRMQRQRRSQQRQSRKTHRQPMWSARLM